MNSVKLSKQQVVIAQWAIDHGAKATLKGKRLTYNPDKIADFMDTANGILQESKSASEHGSNTWVLTSLENKLANGTPVVEKEAKAKVEPKAVAESSPSSDKAVAPAPEAPKGRRGRRPATTPAPEAPKARRGGRRSTK